MSLEALAEGPTPDGKGVRVVLEPADPIVRRAANRILYGVPLLCVGPGLLLVSCLHLIWPAPPDAWRRAVVFLPLMWFGLTSFCFLFIWDQLVDGWVDLYDDRLVRTYRYGPLRFRRTVRVGEIRAVAPDFGSTQRGGAVLLRGRRLGFPLAGSREQAVPLARRVLAWAQNGGAPLEEGLLSSLWADVDERPVAPPVEEAPPGERMDASWGEGSLAVAWPAGRKRTAHLRAEPGRLELDTGHRGKEAKRALRFLGPFHLRWDWLLNPTLCIEGDDGQVLRLAHGLEPRELAWLRCALEPLPSPAETEEELDPPGDSLRLEESSARRFVVRWVSKGFPWRFFWVPPIMLPLAALMAWKFDLGHPGRSWFLTLLLLYMAVLVLVTIAMILFHLWIRSRRWLTLTLTGRWIRIEWHSRFGPEDWQAELEGGDASIRRERFSELDSICEGPVLVGRDGRHLQLGPFFDEEERVWLEHALRRRLSR